MKTVKRYILPNLIAALLSFILLMTFFKLQGASLIYRFILSILFLLIAILPLEIWLRGSKIIKNEKRAVTAWGIFSFLVIGLVEFIVVQIMKWPSSSFSLMFSGTVLLIHSYWNWKPSPIYSLLLASWIVFLGGILFYY